MIGRWVALEAKSEHVLPIETHQDSFEIHSLSVRLLQLALNPHNFLNAQLLRLALKVALHSRNIA